MLPYSEWLDRAVQLNLGRSKRVKHCNHNTTMIVSHTDEGYSAHCFRCNESGFKPHGERRIRELQSKRNQKEYEYAQHRTATLPEDYNSTIPDSAGVWLYSSGVDSDTARSYRIGYSPALKRVILPVYSEPTLTELALVQARAVYPGDIPKYLNQPGVRKDNVLFRSHSAWGASKVCITEDILSCIRVGAVHPCVCCLGTALTDAQVGILMQYDEVVVWLDNDQAGWNGSVKMLGALRMVMQARVVYADADPKCYDNQAIQEILQ